jgi:NADPH:quinone reductase-like Zn-dependent oxidoreductase
MRVTSIGVKTYAEYCTVSAAQVMPLPDFVNLQMVWRFLFKR